MTNRPMAGVRLSLPLAAALAALGTSPGCRRGDVPLPPLDDLYAYSLAVAGRAASHVPSSRARPAYNIGRVHERFGLEDQALEYYREAVEKDSHLAMAYRRIGSILSQRQDRMTDAIDAYMRSIQFELGFPGVYTRIGLLYTHLGRFDDAIEALEQEIRLGTADASTYYDLGKAHALRIEHDLAAAAYERAVELDPGLRAAYYGLAASRRVLGDGEGAARADESFRRLKAAEDAAGSASPEDKMNREEQLAHAAETWLDASDVYLEESARASDAAARADWQRRAVEAVRRALSVHPKHIEAHEALVAIYRSLGNAAGARRTAEAMARAFGDDPALQYAAAQLVLKNAEPADPRAAAEQALVILDRAIELDPGHAAASYQWAFLVLRHFADRPELIARALTRAEAAVRNDPRPRSFDVLAWAYHRAGRLREAKEVLERGIAQFPQDEELRNRLASLATTH